MNETKKSKGRFETVVVKVKSFPWPIVALGYLLLAVNIGGFVTFAFNIEEEQIISRYNKQEYAKK